MDKRSSSAQNCFKLLVTYNNSVKNKYIHNVHPPHVTSKVSVQGNRASTENKSSLFWTVTGTQRHPNLSISLSGALVLKVEKSALVHYSRQSLFSDSYTPPFQSSYLTRHSMHNGTTPTTSTSLAYRQSQRVVPHKRFTT